MSDDTVKMDAIIVGGGPAGMAAAFTLAKAGLDVVVVERGEYAGSKNMGGLIYSTMLSRMIPDCAEKAPIERTVARREVIYLGDRKHAGIRFGREDWSEKPYNYTYIVYRSQFDRWFAAQAEEAGANLLEGMVVDDLIYEGEGEEKKAVGVKIRGDEEFYADAVILADGANCLVTEKARESLGLQAGRIEQEYAVGVKEIIGLPRERLQDRFQLNDIEGAALDFFGTPFEGLVGGGFIYTAKEALHVGAVAKIESVERAGLSPNEMMDRFKEHPVVARMVNGGELLEYSAHMIPEGGYKAMGELVGNGVLITGDAAGFVNMSLYKEGTNHAMESGIAAAETVIQAKGKGDFSKTSLSTYMDKLREGIVLKDLKKYGDVPHIMERTPNLFSLYPEKAVEMMTDFFTVGHETKAAGQKRAIRKFLKGLPKVKFALDAFRARKLV